MKKTALMVSLFASTYVFAEDMPVLYISGDEGKTSTDISAQTVNKTQLDNSISGNGFLGSVIDVNANIDVVDASKNSKTAGEIKPGEISINEAPTYQNNFTIDGMSNNSLLDPLLNNNFSKYDVPGNENSMFLDIDLINSIKVFDSGVSAEYGSFLGGVIDVETIRAGSKPTFKASYKTTSEKLTQIHLIEGQEEQFEKATSANSQPRFEKQFYKLNFTTPLGDSDGLVIGINKKTSIIPGAYFSDFKDLKRDNLNLLVKWSHYFENDSVLDLTATYAPYEATYIQQYVKDSDVLTKGGGYALNANYEANLGFFDSKTSLAYNSSENSREAKNYYKSWLLSSTKDWGVKREGSSEDYSIEGGNGTITKVQQSLLLNSKFVSKEFDFFGLNHKLKTGFSLDYSQASYKRESDLEVYSNPSLNYLVNCNGDTSNCVEGEQYFAEKKIYKKEDTTADILSGSFYLEDMMKYKNLELTVGANISYDNYLNNLNFSPRFNSQYKLTKSTTIFGGLNRYHGKSFLGYKLREARVPYYEQTRNTLQNSVTGWQASATKDDNQYEFSNLKTPYTDETSLGIRQDAFNNRMILKYVGRNSKDMFSSTTGEPTVYDIPDSSFKGYYVPKYMTNNGKSTADIISINIASIEPFRTKYVDMGYKFSTAWRDSTSNISNYMDDDTTNNDVNYVYYNGQFIPSNELPIEESKQVYNLHFDMSFKEFELFGVNSKVKLNNIIRYSGEYSILKARAGEKELYVITYPDGTTKETEVSVYDKVTYKPTTTLDAKVSMDMRLQGSSKLNFTVEINNVFDEIVVSDDYASSYELGRQFWLEVAYIF